MGKDDLINRQAIKTKVKDISSKDLNIDFAEPKVIMTQSIIRQMISAVVAIIDKELPQECEECHYLNQILLDDGK